MKTLKHDPIAIKFQEVSDQRADKKTASSQIQLMRTGIFSYWEPGDTQITKDMFQAMIKNFQNKVVGVDLAVDYSHNAYGEAAGWVKNVFTDASGEELWVEVDWTPEAEEKLAQKKFRYISAEFYWDFRNSETNEKFGPTLVGAGLTNRPFLKKMKPVVEMSDKNKEKKTMDLEKKIEALTASLEQLNSKFSEMEKATKEKDEKIQTLSEKESNREKDAEIEQKKATFDSMLSQGKVVEAQREAFIQGDFAKFAELAQPVKFDSIGDSTAPEQTPKEKKAEDMTAEEAEDKIAELSQEKIKNGMSVSEAHKAVFAENPELAKKYQSKFKF